jgi:hypothetical protein
VLNATVRVAPSASGVADHPRNITMCLNNTEIWTFDGTGFGGFGRQTVFSDELNRADFNFSNTGGPTSLMSGFPAPPRCSRRTLQWTAAGR